jgi:hypothetical protein
MRQANRMEPFAFISCGYQSFPNRGFKVTSGFLQNVLQSCRFMLGKTREASLVRSLSDEAGSNDPPIAHPFSKPFSNKLHF